MKIGLVGISVNADTGYGRMNREIGYRLLKAGHQVWNIGHEAEAHVWGGQKSYNYEDGTKMPVLTIPNPLANPDAASAMVDSYVMKEGIDSLIALWDSWALEFLASTSTKVPWAAYWPVDAPLTREWAGYTEQATMQVAMARFGYHEMLRFYPPSTVRYIQHGVDTKVFRPLSGSDLRERISAFSMVPVPREAFLFSVVGANVGDRKNLPLTLDTFARFHAQRPDSFLYLHTNIVSSHEGYDLRAMIADRRLEGCVSYPSRSPMIHPASNEDLNLLYNASDVLISNSDGEGFGLPILEAQAAGTPVIAASNSAQVELVHGHGWLFGCLPEDAYAYYPDYLRTQQKWPVPDQRELLRAMDDAYVDHGRRDAYGEAGRRFALDYDWDVVMPKWLRLVDDMQEASALEKDLVVTIKRIQEAMA